MPHHCLLYYITDRNQFPGSEPERRSQLLQKIKEAARAGVDYIQLREKDLSIRELQTLALDVVSAVRDNSRPDRPTRILINSRTDVALATQADGVHLRSDDITPDDVCKIWTSARNVLNGRPFDSTPSKPRPGSPARPVLARWGVRPVIAVSCHTPEQVQAAQQNHADFAVFAPVFEKKDVPSVRPAGLEALHQAVQHKIPVLALGGVTLDNAARCLQAGAAGIAAIRLFQENDIQKVVARLRA